MVEVDEYRLVLVVEYSGSLVLIVIGLTPRRSYPLDPSVPDHVAYLFP